MKSRRVCATLPCHLRCDYQDFPEHARIFRRPYQNTNMTVLFAMKIPNLIGALGGPVESW